MQASTWGSPRFRALLSITLVAALMRLVPHPPNFTPIAGMALFGGAHFRDARVAFGLPLMAMFLSDMVLAATVYGVAALRSMPLVYLAFALTVVIGRSLGPHRSAAGVGAASIGAALLFYWITNFGVWMSGSLYPMTSEGLIACYVAAIPYLRNAVVGNLVYALIFFGGFTVAERRFRMLREARSAAAANARS